MRRRPPFSPIDQAVVAGRKTVSALTLHTRLSQFLHEVATSGEELVVTTYGRPTVVISPIVRRTGNTFVGSARGHARLRGSTDTFRTAAATEMKPTTKLAATSSTHPEDSDAAR